MVFGFLASDYNRHCHFLNDLSIFGKNRSSETKIPARQTGIRCFLVKLLIKSLVRRCGIALPCLKEAVFPSCRRSKLCLGAAKRATLVFRFSDDLSIFIDWRGRLKRLSVLTLPFILQSHQCCTTFAPYVLRPAARHRFMSYSALSYSSAQRACPTNMLYCRFCFFRFQTTYECPAPPDRRACLFVRRAHHLAARPQQGADAAVCPDAIACRVPPAS